MKAEDLPRDSAGLPVGVSVVLLAALVGWGWFITHRRPDVPETIPKNSPIFAPSGTSKVRIERSAESLRAEDERIAKVLQPGDIVTLSNSRLPGEEHGPVWLYATEADFTAAAKSAAAHDQVGLQDARGFSVPVGTRVRVIEPHPLSLVAEVRVVGGNHADRAGWALVSQIEP